jgi:hypothetical protein
MFPGAGAQVYYNSDGEPTGWDHYPGYDNPPDPDDFDNDPNGDCEDAADYEPERCEADARVGTGSGVCGRALDPNGYCDRASNHLT